MDVLVFQNRGNGVSVLTINDVQVADAGQYCKYQSITWIHRRRGQAPFQVVPPSMAMVDA